MTDGLKDAHRETIIAVIAANERVERAVLFGSRATGTNTVTSDVDIALFGDRLTLTDQARLAAAIDDIPMAQAVDLLLHNSIRDQDLREHIRGHGIEWFRRLIDSEVKQHVDDEKNGSTITTEEAQDCQWSTVQLGEVADLLTGFPFRSGEYVTDPEAPRLLRGANIAQGNLRWDGAKRWPREATAHLTPYWLRKDDVVIAMDRPWIEAGLKASSVRESDLPALLVQRVARLRGSDRLDARFLSFVIGCHDFAQHVLSVQTGTAVPHISAQQIREFEFPLPHVPEQRAIAHILGTLDDKIELNRRMNETLEAMARALFKSWFVDFDPVRAKMEGRDTGLPQDIADLFPDRLVDSEMGEIPEGWEVFSLDRLADHHTKSTSPLRSPEEEYEHFSIPAYDAGQRPAVEPGAAIRSNKTVVRSDAVLLSKLNPRIPRVWMPADSKGRPQVCSTEFLVFTPRPPANRSLLFALFADQSFRALLKSMVTGTSKSHQRVPPKALKTQEVLAGSPRIFQVFGKVVGNMLLGVVRNRSEVTTLAALRDTLLPKLIAGEIRVPDAERLVESVL